MTECLTGYKDLHVIILFYIYIYSYFIFIFILYLLPLTNKETEAHRGKATDSLQKGGLDSLGSSSYLGAHEPLLGHIPGGHKEDHVHVG